MDQVVIRKRLLNELDELLEKSKRIEKHFTGKAESLPKNREELANFRDNDEVVDALGGMTKKHIADINLALQRMDSGQWNICSECENEINALRLDAAPTVTTCIKCAGKLEC